MTILEAKELKKYYGSGDTLVKALDGVDLAVAQGEFVSIVGTSGSGKSTLLHMLGGLDVPTAGQVIVDGRNISTLKPEELTIFRRRKIGFVFQSYNLVPVLNVYENIVLPIELDGNEVDEDFVEDVIHVLGLDKKRNNLPSQLSGGQQQRVAIARALASKPAIILADEPTGNLDSATSQDVLSLLKVTSDRFGQTVVMITHNEEIPRWQTGSYVSRMERSRAEMRAERAVNSMRKVRNKKVIDKISYKSFRANRTRNVIAIIAIALTAMLFTTLFTVGIGTAENFQRQTMRQAGGDSHGVFATSLLSALSLTSGCLLSFSYCSSVIFLNTP